MHIVWQSIISRKQI